MRLAMEDVSAQERPLIIFRLRLLTFTSHLLLASAVFAWPYTAAISLLSCPVFVLVVRHRRRQYSPKAVPLPADSSAVQRTRTGFWRVHVLYHLAYVPVLAFD